MSRVTLLSILISILSLISGSPVINNDADQNSKNVYPTAEVGEKSIEHKTTTLLAEALQMIHKSRDFKERKWLESFVQRLAKLATELEENSKNEIQNGNEFDDQEKSNKLQNEVLVDGKEKLHFMKRPDNTDVVYSEAPVSANFVSKELDTLNPPQLKVPVTTPEADMISRQVIPLETTSVVTDEPNLTTHSEMFHRVVLQKQILEKNELLKEIFYKIQRLKEIGGSQQDIINLLKKSEENPDSSNSLNDQEDIEFEEEGAATGELEADVSDISTLAPSLGHVAGNTLSTSKKPDEDDLVKQLEGEKFLLVNPDKHGKEEEVLRRINGLVAPSVV